jgi:hypothetical protein
MSAARMIALNGGGSGNPSSDGAPTSPRNSGCGRYDALLLRARRP